jgi:hypothetical protein
MAPAMQKMTPHPIPNPIIILERFQILITAPFLAKNGAIK